MSQAVKFYKQTPDCENLILFIHGFTGGENTWRNDNGIEFPAILLTDEEISEKFDIATYSYYSKLFDSFATASQGFRKIYNLLMRRSSRTEKNLDIEELSQLLKTHFRVSFSKYKSIIVIAHSMGGIIAKSMIANDIEKDGATRVDAMISLAVPHFGVPAAQFGGLISGNLQIRDLRPAHEFIIELSQKWIKLSSLPEIIYIYGSYDGLVTRASANGIEISEKDIVAVPEDHISIAKPESEESIVAKAVVQLIKQQIPKSELKKAGYQKLESVSHYDDEIFVIKMIIADIPDGSQNNAKELFWNAEYLRKAFTSNADRERLSQLYENVRQVYKDCHDKYLSGQFANSGQFLADVHEKITLHDSALLKTVASAIKVYHKKGMIHQLANDLSNDIWWGLERDISSRKDGE